MVNLAGMSVADGYDRRQSRHTSHHQPPHRHHHHHQHLQHSSGGHLHVHSAQSQPPSVYLGRSAYASGAHLVPQHQRTHSCSSHDDDSLSSLSMLSAEQSKRKVRWILSLGLLLPALAAIIGVVAWAVSAEVVMGVQREAALKNQDFASNVYGGHDDFLLNRLESKRLNMNSDRLRLSMVRERMSGDKQISQLQQGNHLSSGSSGSESSNDRTSSHVIPNNAPAKPIAAEEMSNAQRNSLEHQNLYLLPGRQERDSNRKALLPILPVKPNALSSITESDNIHNTKSEVTSPAEAENTEESPEPVKNKNESTDGVDEEEEDLDDENVTSQDILSSSLSSTTTTSTTTTVSSKIISSTTTDQPLVTESSKSDLGVTTKKSAGAQVAEVIDRLVAQRKGITPHIVVVAPFRQKRKPLITQSVRSLSGASLDSEANNDSFAETALLAAAQHRDLLMKRTSKRPVEQSNTESTTSTKASFIKEDENDEEDVAEKDEEDEESDDSSDHLKEKDSITEFKNSKSSKPADNLLNSTEAKSSPDQKNSLSGQIPAKRKSPLELRAESLRKLRSKIRKPIPFASRSLNRPYAGSLSGAVADSTSSSVSEHANTVAPVAAAMTSTKTSVDLDSLSTRVLNSPMGSSNVAYRSKYFVKKSSSPEHANVATSSNSRPDAQAESLHMAAAHSSSQASLKPSLQAFTVREQLYSPRHSITNRQKQAAAAAANALTQRKSKVPVLLNAASLQPATASNPIQRSMHFGSTGYNAYGHSPTQRMQHSINSVQQLSKQQQQQFMAQQQQLLALGQQEMLATATGPQITLAQLAQLYPQQYLEFMQQHQQQINQHQQQQHVPHQQQYQHLQQQQQRNKQHHHHQHLQQQQMQKDPHEPIDPMVAYQQASHQQFLMQPPKTNQASNQVRPGANNGNFGEGTAESIGHQQHVHSNKLLAGSDSSNSAMVNFNVEDGPDKGLSIGLGGGPSSGGAQLITSPMGIFKSLLLPLLPRPRMNLNGKVVFGVVLEKGVGFGKPKKPPVMVHVPHKHSFFGK